MRETRVAELAPRTNRELIGAVIAIPRVGPVVRVALALAKGSPGGVGNGTGRGVVGDRRG